MNRFAGYSFARRRVELEPLTPVHVGSGDSVLGLEYRFCNDAERGPRIARLDYDRYLSQANLRDLVADSMSGAGFDESKCDIRPGPIRDRFLQNKRDELRRKAAKDVDALLAGEPAGGLTLAEWLRQHMPAEFECAAIAVAAEAAEELERALLGERAKGEIHLLPRHGGTQEVYLPGSSVKGAVRTAVVACAARQRGMTAAAEREARRGDVQKSSAPFEAAVLGYEERQRHRDPLRQVRFSDLRLLAGSTRIERIRIVQRPGARRAEDSDPGGIQMWREVVGGLDSSEQAVFEGDLRLAPHLARGEFAAGDKSTPVSQALPLRALLEACNSFYGPRLQDELGKFRCDPAVATALQAARASLAANEALVRVGRHSHFECVTAGEPYCRAPQRGYGKTRSYAGGKSPLGWAILRVLD